MSSLSLLLEKHSVATSLGAVATLRRVADASGQAISQGERFEIVIPANAGAAARDVAVDPGRWLVEATLPSGEIVTEEITVATGQNLPVTIRSAENAPNEWLGLQYLVGNVEGAQTLEQRRKDAQGSALTLERRGPTPSAKQPSAHICEKPGVLRGAEAWTNILSLEPMEFTAWAPTWEDRLEATWLYRIVGGTGRRFAHVEWLEERFVVSLPLPWRGLADLRDVPVQVMVRTEPRQENVQIGVIVEDPEFAAMAGLMTASTLPKAVTAVRQASDLLLGKAMHPLGAAAGGYVLLAAGDPSDIGWPDWVDNLALRFTDIPDGAILKASLRLRFPKDEHSAEEARTSLLEAFDRGIPYYSAGVSWLLDGLTLFADDPAVEQRMLMVQRVAQRLDLSQAFTVIRISDRRKP